MRVVDADDCCCVPKETHRVKTITALKPSTRPRTNPALQIAEAGNCFLRGAMKDCVALGEGRCQKRNRLTAWATRTVRDADWLYRPPSSIRSRTVFCAVPEFRQACAFSSWGAESGMFR